MSHVLRVFFYMETQVLSSFYVGPQQFSKLWSHCYLHPTWGREKKEWREDLYFIQTLAQRYSMPCPLTFHYRGRLGNILIALGWQTSFQKQINLCYESRRPMLLTCLPSIHPLGHPGWSFGQSPVGGLVSIQFSSVAQSCLTLCNPMNRTPSLPVHHQLPELTQTHVHWVGDAIQPSHPLSSPSPPAPNPSQHQSLFQRVNSSHEVAKVLEFQL